MGAHVALTQTLLAPRAGVFIFGLMKQTRTLTAAALSLATLLSALPAQAAQLSLGQISSYLNGIQTAVADFTQINADGTIETGKLSLRRPGRMRFDYNGSNSLVMAGGSTVAIFDERAHAKTPEQYPLVQTPLHIILEKNVNLGQRGMVTGQSYDGTATTVIAQDPQHPEYGHIEMKFTDNPVQLRQWIVVDGQGTRTTTALGNMTTGVSLGAGTFSIEAEISKRGG